MFRLPAEWIFATPYSVHSWMDSTSVYYSLIPVPYVYLPFLLFALSAVIAKSKKWMTWFIALALATQLFGVVICGYLLTICGLWWTGVCFKSDDTSSVASGTTALSCLLLVAAWLFGFPHTVLFSPAVCGSNLKNVDTAILMYQTDWNGEVPIKLVQLTPNYLKEIPLCPADLNGPSSILFKVQGENCVISCQNPVHRTSGMEVEPIVRPVIDKPAAPGGDNAPEQKAP